MSLRFFADHCVPESVALALERAGLDVQRLREAMPIGAPDAVVLAEAQTRDAILLSLKGDFADIVAYPPQDYGGIAALQIRSRPEAIGFFMDRLIDSLEDHDDPKHYHGRLLPVEAPRIRVRDTA